MSRYELDAAKERLRLPELWRILNLSGEPPTRDGVKFSSPFRPDVHPSCSFYDDCRRMMDWSTGKKYDGVTMFVEALGLQNGEAIRRFIEIASGQPISIDRSPVDQSEQKIKQERPVLSGLRKVTDVELNGIAASRSIDVRAVRLAQDLGTLRVGEVCGYLSWVLFDKSGLCAEARRLNRKPYPAVVVDGRVRLGVRKAHTLRGSRKDWPVGILPTKEFRQNIAGFLLVEGGPDYLASLHFALIQKRTDILPVAILGRGQALRGPHPDSLEHFHNRRVRIVPHDDPDGGSYRSALIWAKQLQKVDCEVDFFVFSGLLRADATQVKDLNDCTELAPQSASKLEELFP
jgi:hypothetical protein